MYINQVFLAQAISNTNTHGWLRRPVSIELNSIRLFVKAILGETEDYETVQRTKMRG